MYLQKNKKGFTLIELMVVVAIIGILALLGLRLYTGQQEKAKNAIVRANAGTVQTLIQANLADKTYDSAQAAINDLGTHGMQNPFSDDPNANVVEVNSAATEIGATTIMPGTPVLGAVYVAKVTNEQIFYVQGATAGSVATTNLLTAQR